VFGAESDGTLFLGEDLLVYLVLAFGAALFVGNVAALLRPPAPPDGAPGGDEPVRAPVARSLVMAGLGLIGAVWALASLVAGCPARAGQPDEVIRPGRRGCRSRRR
jgi:hypothetical protein